MLSKISVLASFFLIMQKITVSPNSCWWEAGANFSENYFDMTASWLYILECMYMYSFVLLFINFKLC